MTAGSRSFVIVALLGSIARAQPAEVDAEALFREGRRLLEQGKLAEACNKLDASARLDESVGTLLDVGDCREKNGQLATAWEAFTDAAATARDKHDNREPIARQRAAALEPRLSHVTITIPDADRVPGLTLARDGVPIELEQWALGVPLDGGLHEIVGSAPGYQPWRTMIDIATEGEEQRITAPRFERVPEPVPPPRLHEQPSEAAPPRSRFTTLRMLSLGAAAVGLGGIAGGIHWGLEARDLERQANALCPGTMCSDPYAGSLVHSARQDALASDVMFGVGGAAIVSAAVMWWVGAPTTVTATDHSIAIAGRF